MSIVMEMDSCALCNQLTSQRKPTEKELIDAMTLALLRVLRHGDHQARISHDYFGLYRTSDLNAVIKRQFPTMSHESYTKRMNSVLEALTETEKIEFRADKIRALYGHSLRGIIVGALKWPEVPLFHATCKRHLDSILEDGLRPQGRTWVHLTSETEYAYRIFRNHSFDGHPVLLEIDASSLEEHDVNFRQPNSHVWLANYIPSVGIKIHEPNDRSEFGSWL